MVRPSFGIRIGVAALTYAPRNCGLALLEECGAALVGVGAVEHEADHRLLVAQARAERHLRRRARRVRLSSLSTSGDFCGDLLGDSASLRHQLGRPARPC